MKKLLFSLALAGILIACGEKSKEADTEIDPEKVKADAVADSIKKAELAQAEYYKQDSISALQIKGYSVKKISGNHTYDEKTEVEYKSLFQVLDETREKAKKEMWTDAQLKSTLSEYKGLFKGGQIKLNVERLTIDAANTNTFTIIVKDSKDKEVMRRSQPDNIANYSKTSDYWWNIAIESIDERIETPFYIYVVDELSDEPFKFEVTPIKK